MRVALDTSFAGINPTGVGLYSKRLAEHLAKLAEERHFRLVCYGPSCPDAAANVQTFKRSNVQTFRGVYQEWPTYTQGFLPLALARFRPDIVHATSHLGPLWGPGRLVVTVHDLIFRRFPGDYNPFWLRTTETLLPRVLRRAGVVIADSEATRSDLLRFYRVRSDKVRVVYPGIDEAFRVPVSAERLEIMRRKFDIGGASYILCLGPWVRRKNLEVVVEAFASLSERLPNVHLAITGRPSAGMRNSGVASAIEKLPESAKRKVHIVGHLPGDELHALMQGASVLAYPSLVEGFGLPPLEAMCAGVPVVASDAAAVVEATGGAALIAGSGDRRDWTEALYWVLSDSAKAAELSARGRDRSASFTWERCASQMVSLYEFITKEP